MYQKITCVAVHLHSRAQQLMHITVDKNITHVQADNPDTSHCTHHLSMRILSYIPSVSADASTSLATVGGATGGRVSGKGR